MKGALLPLALAALAAPADALVRRNPREAHNPNHPLRHLADRAIVYDPTTVNGKEYDYVIIGGGLAGLTVAGRLSEWNNVTVLVIEAGGDGSDVNFQQEVPGFAYMKGLTGSAYGWNFTTTNQTEMAGAAKKYPLGRGLGGSGAVNGMFWGRASSDEYNAFDTLNPNGAVKWNWDVTNSYIKKAENFEPPPAEQAKDFHIEYDVLAHGKGGPIHTGFSRYIYPVVANWVPTWTGLGLPSHDHATGSVRGACITPSTLNGKTQKRCSSRTGYLEENGGKDRPNLTVLTHNMGTRIVFDSQPGNITATGVEFMTSGATVPFSVKVKKEVIVASGAIGTPKVLQLSGIGPTALLQKVGITPVVDLPVGYNFQEHVSYPMYWSTIDGIETWYNLATNQSGAQDAALAQWEADGSGPLTYINEAVGYIAASDMYGADGAAQLASSLDLDALVKTQAALTGMPASVQQGLKKQYDIQKTWLTKDIGQFEVIFHLWGADTRSLGIQVALQHPFSRGMVSIQSKDPMQMPAINPEYYGASVDADMHNAAATWVRKLASSQPLGGILQTETLPGANLTGAALTEALKKGAGTEYHPCGTCSMLPRDDGGVVDTNLKVYGLNNVRVADASIIPIHISAHMMASTYGIAEHAADLIKKDSSRPAVASSAAPAATSAGAAPSSAPVADAGAGAAADDSASSQKGSAGSSALSVGAKVGIAIGAIAGAALLLALLALLCFKKKRTDPVDQNGWYKRHEASAGAAGAAPLVGGPGDAYAMAPSSGQRDFGASAGAGASNYSLNAGPHRPLSVAGSIDTMDTGDLPRHNQDERPSYDSRRF